MIFCYKIIIFFLIHSCRQTPEAQSAKWSLASDLRWKLGVGPHLRAESFETTTPRYYMEEASQHEIVKHQIYNISLTSARWELSDKNLKVLHEDASQHEIFKHQIHILGSNLRAESSEAQPQGIAYKGISISSWNIIASDLWFWAHVCALRALRCIQITFLRTRQ